MTEANRQTWEAGAAPVETAAEQSPFVRTAPARRPRSRHADVLAVIALGGGLGSVGRYLLTEAWPAGSGGFPWATFVINVTGCFLLGGLMVFLLQVWPPGRYLRPFLGVGLCGGFTTFSTYTLEIRDLAAVGERGPAAAYALATLVAALAAVWAGIVTARLSAGVAVRHRAGTGRQP